MRNNPQEYVMELLIVGNSPLRRYHFSCAMIEDSALAIQKASSIGYYVLIWLQRPAV